MEGDSGSTGGLNIGHDDNADGSKKSTHLELQEKYGGEAVTVSYLGTKNIQSVSLDMRHFNLCIVSLQINTIFYIIIDHNI